MRRRGVLIVVQNLPVPLDRRVWLECQTLRDAGYDVSVICPKGPGDPSFEVLDEVSLYKYTATPATTGLLSYLFEFVWCWIRTAVLSLKVYRHHRFGVLQACNPPDTYWLLGAFWKLFGVRYVFDQHDLNPELFRSRFGDPQGVGGKAQLAVLEWLERRTYRTADHVVVTNESYRRIALGRGRRQPADVTVVRSGPDTTQMRPLVSDPDLRPAPYLLAYLGIMGPQDNVEVLLDVMDVLVARGRRDVHLVLMGFGDRLEALREDTTARGLDPYVTFTGRADRRMIADHLSAAHIGLSPDLKTPLNDVSTHNKTMEYMAFALPVVAFDLVESRNSSARASLYVESGDVEAFADAVETLLDDADRRVEMGRLARNRCVAELDWAPQSRAYLRVYDRPTGRTPGAGAVPAPNDERNALPPVDPDGRRYVDLRDPVAFEAFLRTRGVPPPSVGATVLGDMSDLRELPTMSLNGMPAPAVEMTVETPKNVVGAENATQ